MLIALVLWNLAVFCMFGVDKRKARLHRRRISEKTLILSSLMMGSAGGLAGMYLFRHKTKHRKFWVLLIAGLILQIAALYIWNQHFALI